MGEETPTLEKALDLLLQYTPSPGKVISVPLLDALGRVAARDCVAPFDQPPFDRSPLYGYAVRHEDIAAADTEKWNKSMDPDVLFRQDRILARYNLLGTVLEG